MDRPNTGVQAENAAESRGQRTLCLLVGLWLFGSVDLCLSAVAQAHGLLDADSECNPFAARVVPLGPAALVTYKGLLTAGGTAGLVFCRRRRIATWAAAGALIVYALVALNWLLFYGMFAPLQEWSLGVGGFCSWAGRFGWLTVVLMVAACAVAGGCRRSSKLRCRARFRFAEQRTVEAKLMNGGTRRPSLIGLCGATAMVVGICLIPLSCSPARSAQQDLGEAVGGTIYFQEWFGPQERLWRMNADGSDKTALPPGVRGEPSRQLHGGYRWFLDVRDIPGATYPDGRQRRELFAVRSDGFSVQLTEQPDLEPSPFTARWPMHAADRMISWVARRWDHTGQVVEGGIYTASITLDDDEQVVGLAEQPHDPLVRLELALVRDFDPWWRTWAPDIRSHDWSPDGAAVVYDSTESELCVAALPAGRITCITTVPTIDPVWSPDGQRIAFRIGKPFREIATIRPDGSDLKTVTVRPSGEWFNVTTPMWSPTGEYLIYRQVRVPKAVELPADVDVFLASVDGGFRANLTADVDTLLTPVAWRHGDAYETMATAQPRQ